MDNKLYDVDYLKRLQDLFDKTKRKSYQLLDAQPGDIIADIGCGIGKDALEIANSGATTYGIDHDPAMVAVARQLERKDLPVHFLCGEADNLPLDDNSINKIRFDRVLQHIENHEKVLSEVKRVLRTGGVIQIIDTDYLSFTLALGDEKFEHHIVHRVAYHRIPNGHKVREIPSALLRNSFEITTEEVHNYIISDFDLANYVIRFDKVVDEEFKNGNISEDNYKLWQSQRSRPNGQFNFSFNLIVLNATVVK